LQDEWFVGTDELKADHCVVYSVGGLSERKVQQGYFG
jgi:hypothetical protein